METDVPSEDSDLYCSLSKSIFSHGEINRPVGFALSLLDKIRGQSDVHNYRPEKLIGSDVCHTRVNIYLRSTFVLILAVQWNPSIRTPLK